MNFRSLFLVVALAAAGTSTSVRGAVAFSFTYSDAGTGFNDPVLGGARRSALENAANAFAQSLSAYSATIEVTVDGNAPSDSLMAAGSVSVSDSFAGGGFGRTEVILNKILTNGGTDLNGSDSDGLLSVNFTDTLWEFDPDPGAVGAGEFDWYSTVYHEFAHTLGFSHLIVDQGPDSGEDGFGTGGFGSGQPGEWGKFDQFLSDNVSNRILSEVTFENTLIQADWDALVIGGASPANGLFFDGPNAQAANGGNPIGLYTPNPFEPGSSIAHLDDENGALAGQLMLAFVSDGLAARTFSDVELGILRDLGFTNIAQIEPPLSPGQS